MIADTESSICGMCESDHKKKRTPEFSLVKYSGQKELMHIF